MRQTVVSMPLVTSDSSTATLPNSKVQIVDNHFIITDFVAYTDTFTNHAKFYKIGKYWNLFSAQILFNNICSTKQQQQPNFKFI